MCRLAITHRTGSIPAFRYGILFKWFVTVKKIPVGDILLGGNSSYYNPYSSHFGIIVRNPREFYLSVVGFICHLTFENSCLRRKQMFFQQFNGSNRFSPSVIAGGAACLIVARLHLFL